MADYNVKIGRKDYTLSGREEVLSFLGGLLEEMGEEGVSIHKRENDCDGLEELVDSLRKRLEAPDAEQAPLEGYTEKILGGREGIVSVEWKTPGGRKLLVRMNMDLRDEKTPFVFLVQEYPFSQVEIRSQIVFSRHESSSEPTVYETLGEALKRMDFHPQSVFLKSVEALRILMKERLLKLSGKYKQLIEDLGVDEWYHLKEQPNGYNEWRECLGGISFSISVRVAGEFPMGTYEISGNADLPLECHRDYSYNLVSWSKLIRLEDYTEPPIYKLPYYLESQALHKLASLHDNLKAAIKGEKEEPDV